MKELIVKSLFFAILASLVMWLVRIYFRTEAYLSDVSGISAFATIFGTLYGILTAFVVVEVWSQYNSTEQLLEREALGLEKLFSLTLYFRDNKLNSKIKNAIKKYIDLVTSSFTELGKGRRHQESSKAFRDIAKIIRDVKFDDDHDQIVFNQVVENYHELSQIRVDRINQSLSRLPRLLRVFLYVSSFIGLALFITMPFVNPFYGFFTTGALAFILAMVFQLVEDLDNPFKGYWNITPEPFERALKHIEEDY